MRVKNPVWAVALGLLAATASHGQDIPYRGMVTSVEQNSSLTWECAVQSPSIQCDFVQTLVRQEPPLTSEQRDTQVKQALAEFNDGAMCGRVLKELRSAPSVAPEAYEDSRARRTLAEYISALELFCAGPSEQTAGALIDLGEAKKAQSCTVSTLPFKLSFSWNNQATRWETVSSPEGGCGVVTMVFMEKDKTYPVFWNYREVSLVTNKTGEDAIRGDCSAWPEEETHYRWQSDTLNKSCEFISFGY